MSRFEKSWLHDGSFLMPALHFVLKEMDEKPPVTLVSSTKIKHQMLKYQYIQ